MKDQDLKQLFDLYCHLKSYDKNYIISQNQFYRYAMVNAYLTKIASGKSEKISGFIMAYISSVRKAKIDAMFVSEENRRLGIGTRLLNALEKDLHRYADIKYLSIRLHENFVHSIPFFSKMNYNIIARLNNYVKDDVNFPFQVNDGVNIRRARIKDVPGILELENRCFDDYWRMSKMRIEEILNDPLKVIFIAFMDRKIIGFNFNAISKLSKIGNYVRIATLPEYRQQRIATALSSKAFAWFQSQGAKQVLLCTYADSDLHNDMYKRWGFNFVDQEIIIAKEFMKSKNNS
jgi:ribosomal protein S18 acetylase RimI-like enzyme